MQPSGGDGGVPLRERIVRGMGKSNPYPTEEAIDDMPLGPITRTSSNYVDSDFGDEFASYAERDSGIDETELLNQLQIPGERRTSRADAIRRPSGVDDSPLMRSDAEARLVQQLKDEEEMWERNRRESSVGLRPKVYSTHTGSHTVTDPPFHVQHPIPARGRTESVDHTPSYMPPKQRMTGVQRPHPPVDMEGRVKQVASEAERFRSLGHELIPLKLFDELYGCVSFLATDLEHSRLAIQEGDRQRGILNAEIEKLRSVNTQLIEANQNTRGSQQILETLRTSENMYQNRISVLEAEIADLKDNETRTANVLAVCEEALQASREANAQQENERKQMAVSLASKDYELEQAAFEMESLRREIAALQIAGDEKAMEKHREAEGYRQQYDEALQKMSECTAKVKCGEDMVADLRGQIRNLEETVEEQEAVSMALRERLAKQEVELCSGAEQIQSYKNTVAAKEQHLNIVLRKHRLKAATILEWVNHARMLARRFGMWRAGVWQQSMERMMRECKMRYDADVENAWQKMSIAEDRATKSEEELQVLVQRQTREIEKLKQQLEAERKQYKQRQDDSRREREDEVDALRSEHAMEVDRLLRKHAAEVQSIKQKYADEIEALQREVALSRQDVATSRKEAHKAQREGQMEHLAKVTALEDEKAALEHQVTSLKQGLEVKHREISMLHQHVSRLRVEGAEAVARQTLKGNFTLLYEQVEWHGQLQRMKRDAEDQLSRKLADADFKLKRKESLIRKQKEEVEFVRRRSESLARREGEAQRMAIEEEWTKKLKEEQERMAQELDQHKARQLEMEEELSRQESEMVQLREEQVARDRRQQQDTITAATKQLQELQEKVEESHRKDFEAAARRHAEEVAELKKEIEGLRQQLQRSQGSAEDEIHFLQTALTEARERIGSLEENLRALQEKLETVEAALEMAKEESASLKVALQEVKAALQTAVEQLQDVEAKKDNISLEAERLKDELSTLQARHRMEEEAWKEELKTLREAHHMKEAALTEELSKVVAESKAHEERVRVECQRNIEGLHGQEEKLRAELQRTLESLYHNEGELMALRQQCEALTKASAATLADKQILESQLEEHGKQKAAAARRTKGRLVANLLTGTVRTVQYRFFRKLCTFAVSRTQTRRLVRERLKQREVAYKGVHKSTALRTMGAAFRALWQLVAERREKRLHAGRRALAGQRVVQAVGLARTTERIVLQRYLRKLQGHALLRVSQRHARNEQMHLQTRRMKVQRALHSMTTRSKMQHAFMALRQYSCERALRREVDALTQQHMNVVAELRERHDAVVKDMGQSHQHKMSILGHTLEEEKAAHDNALLALQREVAELKSAADTAKEEQVSLSSALADLQAKHRALSLREEEVVGALCSMLGRDVTSLPEPGETISELLEAAGFKIQQAERAHMVEQLEEDLLLHKQLLKDVQNDAQLRQQELRVLEEEVNRQKLEIGWKNHRLKLLQETVEGTRYLDQEARERVKELEKTTKLTEEQIKSIKRKTSGRYNTGW